MATLKTAADVVQRGDLVVVDLKRGPFAAFVQALDYHYLDGQEFTTVILRDQDGLHCQVTLDELAAAQARAEGVR